MNTLLENSTLSNITPAYSSPTFVAKEITEKLKQIVPYAKKSFIDDTNGRTFFSIMVEIDTEQLLESNKDSRTIVNKARKVINAYRKAYAGKLSIETQHIEAPKKEWHYHKKIYNTNTLQISLEIY